METVERIKITRKKALKLAKERVEKNPDYVYSSRAQEPGSDGLSCRYEFNGRPDCLVGCVLYDAGVPLSVLRSWDRNAEGNLYEVRLPAYLEITERALVFLQVAQASQDSGDRWGEAFEEAKSATSKGAEW